MKIFKTNKKYKVKLKYKQPPTYVYIFIPFTGILLMTLVFTVENLISIINNNFSMPQIFYLITFFITIILSGISYTKSPLSFSKNKDVRIALLKIIEENKFYYENQNRIVSSMKFIYYWINNELFLEVYPMGGKYALKMDELTRIFETALNKTVISIQNDSPNHTTYILVDSSNNQINTQEELNLFTDEKFN